MLIIVLENISPLPPLLFVGFMLKVVFVRGLRAALRRPRGQREGRTTAAAKKLRLPAFSAAAASAGRLTAVAASGGAKPKLAPCISPVSFQFRFLPYLKLRSAISSNSDWWCSP
jgi:hypothetical protein